MSTVNPPFAPLPARLHLPSANAALHGLCGEAVLSDRRLTPDVKLVACATCLWTMFAVLLAQQNLVAAALATLHNVALPKQPY